MKTIIMRGGLKMKRVNQYSFIVMITASFVLISPGAAFAYLDPGTGSMILQGILGGLAAIAVAGKIYWSRLKSFFGFRKTKSDSGSAEGDDGFRDKKKGQ